MAKCDTCGNEYPNCFEVVMSGKRHFFDSFECAIHRLAPVCAHCGCTIMGHGFGANDGTLYCCEHCSRHGSEAKS